MAFISLLHLFLVFYYSETSSPTAIFQTYKVPFSRHMESRHTAKCVCTPFQSPWPVATIVMEGYMGGGPNPANLGLGHPMSYMSLASQITHQNASFQAKPPNPLEIIAF